LKKHGALIMKNALTLIEQGQVLKKISDWHCIDVVTEDGPLEPCANRLAGFESQPKMN